MTIVYLSLGANLGNREASLRQALEKLGKLPRTRMVSVSSIYETAAWGKTDQPDFLNLCCSLETDLTAQDLLAACQKIEAELGRVRHEQWGPRTIDIDILLFGRAVIHEANLQVPHPYMTEREFVLKPLADIAGAYSHPLTSQIIQDLLAKVESTNVRFYADFL